MGSIFFNQINTRTTFLKKRKFKQFLYGIFDNECVLIKRIDIIFCSDKFLISLNKDFLLHDFYTDTLTFILSDINKHVTGEVYISIDRIKENSEKYKEEYQTELARVIIHGCLHLCGYVDKPKKNAKSLQLIQEKYVKTWIVSRET